MKRTVLAGAVAVGAAVFQGGSAMAEQPANALAQALGDAWNRGDAVAFGAQFWPDARFVNVLAHVYAGRDEIVAQHARIFATIYKGSHGSFSVAHTTPLGGDHQLVELDAAVTGAVALPPGMVLVNGAARAHFMMVLERRQGEWHAVYAQNTGFTPLPTAPPAQH